MDDIDAMLQAEDQPPASPAGTTPPEPGQPMTEPESQKPEEVEFNTLKGNTQDRIKQILRDRDMWREKASNATPPPYIPPNPQNPQVQDAVSKLEAVGIATKKTVEQAIDERLGLLRYQNEVDRLSSVYNGDRGPKFDKDEYEDYIVKHPQYRGYLPEDVFKMKMYPEEFHDLEQQPQVRRTTTLKPTKSTVTEEPLTPELIESRLKEPDGREWYDKNYEKVNRVLAKSAQG